MKLGFIGLGVMGRPMALNLMRHGHEMGIYARRDPSAAPLVEAVCAALRAEPPAHAAKNQNRTWMTVIDRGSIVGVERREALTCGACTGRRKKRVRECGSA